MRTKSLLIALFLIAALSFANSAWAVECCCKPLKCIFVPWFGDPDPEDLTKSCPNCLVMTVNDCYSWQDDQAWMCDEDLICWSEFAASEHAPLFLLYPNLVIEGLCDLSLEDDDCEIESLLGDDHPQLDILREFRDEVLGGSEKGKGLIAAYYEHRDVLIEAFEKNPGIEAFATEILVKTIERLEKTLGSEEKLLTDEISTDIDILIAELDAAVASPELKKTMKQIKRAIRKGTLFE
jgi:hypothetical protein